MVVDKDLGWNRIVREVRKADRSAVKVGFPAEGELKLSKKATKNEDTRETMSDMITVAAVNEFGAPKVNIPERSFMRSTYDESVQLLNEMKRSEYLKILMGKTTVEMSLTKIGLWFQRQVQRKIRTLRIPPNAPSTIRKKGSSNPLIDTGSMVQSVQISVKLGGYGTSK